eukprot:gnl/TRDRNA2_/TRDRNA2_85590_c1_seq2.p1 gnl/TRDRNA2_/TRDRNA2_85590_c1~~gnl/TRDRNA2_/TRDRNA2_85590_c1_seq2.p1  ORF type:complete len:276 (-),score=93.50 gnl/TRDRNA2_/TRDRNA2_85590_c1_seq2:134-931(-)
MLRIVAVFFIATLCLASAARVSSDPKKKLRKAGNAVALKSHNNASVHAMEVVADKCKCKFIGHCTCRQAMEFMDCISDACASGECDCHEMQFKHACQQMSDTCESVGLQCSKDKATCLHQKPPSEESEEEVLLDLGDLKERKCKLEEAEKRGYLNADERLRELKPKIQARKDQLKAMGSKKKPNMDCDKPMLVGDDEEEEEEAEKEEEDEEEGGKGKKRKKAESRDFDDQVDDAMDATRTIVCIVVILLSVGGLVGMMFLMKKYS